MIHGVVLEEPGGEPAPVRVSGFDDARVFGFIALYHVFFTKVDGVRLLLRTAAEACLPALRLQIEVLNSGDLVTEMTGCRKVPG